MSSFFRVIVASFLGIFVPGMATVEESIHEFSENYEYNHGGPEVS